MKKLMLSILLVCSPLFGNQNEDVGDILKLAIPALGLVRTLTLDDDRLDGLAQWTSTILVTQGITESLKVATHKRRPNGGCCKSFPSGHTSGAFSGAAFIHKRYGWQKAIIPYLGASFVAFSRVDADKHYWEDVIAGAAIGSITGYFFTTNVALEASPNYLGFSIKRNW